MVFDFSFFKASRSFKKKKTFYVEFVGEHRFEWVSFACAVMTARQIDHKLSCFSNFAVKTATVHVMVKTITSKVSFSLQDQQLFRGI